jgi:hypothetical protein
MAPYFQAYYSHGFSIDLLLKVDRRYRHGLLRVGFESNLKAFQMFERWDCRSDSGLQERAMGEKDPVAPGAIK